MSEVRIGSKPFPWCATEISVSRSGPALGTDVVPWTIMIRTGASSLQTYATDKELLALSEMLNDAVSQSLILRNQKEPA